MFASGVGGRVLDLDDLNAASEAERSGAAGKLDGEQGEQHGNEDSVHTHLREHGLTIWRSASEGEFFRLIKRGRMAGCASRPGRD